MRKLLFTLLVALGTSAVVQGQDNEFPNLQNDLFGKENYSIGIQTRFQIPMPLGIGVEASYYKPNIIHVDAEVGYGWTFMTEKPEGSEGSYFKPWVRAHAGWPFHFKTKGSIKFTTAIAKVAKGSEATYYKLKAPAHHFIMPEVGIYMNPMSKKINATNRYHFLARTAAFGLAYKYIVKADMKVKDSKSGRVYAGAYRSYAHVRAGILRPIDDQIDVPGSSAIQQSTKPGYYVNLAWHVPYYDYSYGIGLQSLGYDDKAAFYLTWTIFIK